MAERITENLARQLLPPERNATAHKGDFGRVLLLCGSVGYTGAAALAAQSAARSGAGLVYLGVPEPIYPILAAKLTEPIVFPLPSEDGKFSEKAIDAIRPRLAQMDCVLIGPGCGQSEGVFALVSFVLQNAPCPVVLDADGINALSEHTDVLRESACPTVITPHPGEFRRIGGLQELPREDAAAELARRLKTICVLKGHETVVSDGEKTFVNTTGNPGMATGGSGDVLAGMLTALIGQKVQPLEAATAAVWLHGAAGDLCAKELGQMAMLPSDMVNALCRLLP